jgi:hypothetical protein
MIQLMHPIRDNLWDKASKIILSEIRAETGILSGYPQVWLNSKNVYLLWCEGS